MPYWALCVAAGLAAAACGREVPFSLLELAADAGTRTGGAGTDGASGAQDALPAGSDATTPPPNTDASTPPGRDADTPPPRRDAMVPPGRDADVPPGRDADVPPRTDAGQMAECLSDNDCDERCHPTLNVCVECYESDHCGRRNTCDPISFTCEQPCFGGRCQPGRICDPASDTCVECLSDNDCDGAERCDLTRRSCVECTSNADCAANVAENVCHPTENECVGCASDADCNIGEACDPDDQFCRPNNGRALCTQCDDDDQCGGPNDLCIGYVQGGGFVDRTCSQDCSNAACPRAFECITVRGNQRQCRPRYEMQSPTCAGIRNLGAMCPLMSGSLDPGCGISGLQDARCEAAGAGTNTGVCVIWCDTNDHCPTGFTCTGATSQDPGRCL